VNLYDWLLLGHILAGMIWLGGGLMLVFVARRVRAAGDPDAILDFAHSLSYLGPRVLAPAVIGVLVFGVALVLASSSWDFGQLWVLVAIGLFVVAFAIGAVYLSQVALRLERTGTADPSASRQLLGRWVTAYQVVLLVLLLIVADMVFKPGLGG
jgi:uncharacterized membrane protein